MGLSKYSYMNLDTHLFVKWNKQHWLGRFRQFLFMCAYFCESTRFAAKLEISRETSQPAWPNG